jgi:two-component system, LuxR family, sensor kinase FixL
VCVLTFVAFREARSWSREVIARLHVAGDVFANAITRRQAKRRFEQQQNELAHVARVAAMGELAAVIAHELDQPLTAIVSNAEAAGYLLQGARPNLAEASDALKDVVDSAMLAAEIVKRERHLLRKSQLNVEPVDLNEAVRDIELFIRAEARQAGAKVFIELVPGLPPVTGDRVQLQQVILNLARNGVQAMRDQPSETRELVVRTTSGSAEVTLTVSDAGPPAADAVLLEKMFEPFYTTKPNGLGMGLAISRSILDAHHGRNWAERNPAGRGISMHVAVPRK